MSDAKQSQAVIRCRRTVLATAIALLGTWGITGAAHASLTWDANGGNGGDWNTAANWSPDAVPTSADDVVISSHSDATHPVTITAPAVAGSVNSTTSGNLYLDIEDDLTVSGTSGIFAVHAKGTGIVTQSAGTLTATTFSLSNATTANGTGSFTLSGTGSVSVSGALTAVGGSTNNTFIQNGANTNAHFGSITSGGTAFGDRWTYQLSAGTLTVDTTVSRSYGDWLFQQTGGTASIGTNLMMGTDYRASPVDPMEWIISGNSQLSIGGNVQLGYAFDGSGSHPGTNSNGRITLDGSKSGGSDVTVGGNWRQTGPHAANNAWGELEGIIDADAISTPADMRKVVVTGSVTFDSGSLLFPEFDPLATPTAGTWTLLTWSGPLTDNGLTLDPATAPGWSFNLDAVNDRLTVTYSVPEPASALLMLSAGGLALLTRRRRLGARA